MRIFVGVELPEPLRQAAAHTSGALQSRIRRVAPRARIRWVEPANLHVTLWFIGETHDARVRDVSTVLEPPFGTTSFALRLGAAGAFPASGPPRVLWLGIAAGGARLAALHAEVEARLNGLGFPLDARVYSAHLTLARIKEVRRRDQAAVREALAAARPDPAESSVTHVTLFRSHQSSSGSRYEPLLRVPLS